MKRYKVFLASSSELALERKEIALMISRRNNAWTEKDVYVELVVWEDLLHSFRGERIQDYFNEQLLKCDIVIALFHKKVGQFTEEEFRLAYENLKKGKKPDFLFVYFKSGMFTSEEIDEIGEELLKISKLKKEIQAYKQIYGSFNSPEDLILKLRDQLEQAIFQQQTAAPRVDKAAEAEKAKCDLEEYRRHVEQKFRYLDFTGLNAILQKPLELENVYVKLRAKKHLPGEPYRGLYSLASFMLLSFEAGRIDLEAAVERSEEDFVILFERLNKKKKKRHALRLLILGHPGSGKTTMMKWTVLQCLKEKGAFVSRFTPVFISLKELGADPGHTFRKKNIGSMCVDLFKQENVSIESFFDSHFKENRLLFLFDGLDEIGDEQIRREVINWLQKQYLGQNVLIVTSRFSGIRREKGLKFRDEIPVFEIQDFTMKDVETFLRNWYRCVEVAVAGEQEVQKAAEQGGKRYEELIGIINDESNKNLRELAVNPLLLTIIAIVHRTRAVLPRDRYKLYEECLRVMIELWNLANRKVDISFSYENSVSQLSKIAKRLMESESRELDKAEIEKCGLPATIENQTRDFFLNDMVLKAGLLYESEGKYGFLHLTFQEYLTAYYFANSKNQNDILKHHNKDYWQETFKLFVNIGNAEILFQEILDDLIEKEYWKNMEFWEDCLKEIAREDTRQSIELGFARRVVDILSQLEYKKENDKLINELYLYDIHFRHASHLVKEGQHLFYNAPHPFVQSIGASILSRTDDHNKKYLIVQLKKRIEDFAKLPKKSNKDILFFLLQNNNNFSILVESRQNLADYYYILAKLKSENLFLRYLILQALNRLRSDLQSIYTFMGKTYPTYSDLQFYSDVKYYRNLIKLLNLQSLPNISCLSGHTDKGGYFVFRDQIYFLRHDLGIFKKKYKDILKKNQQEILDWTDRAVEKLHSLPDKELLKYFPDTTKAELKEFRDSYAVEKRGAIKKG